MSFCGCLLFRLEESALARHTLFRHHREEQSVMKGNNKLFTYVVAVAVIGLLLLIVLKVVGSNSEKKKQANVSEGVAYLKGLEAQDTNEINAIKEERRRAEIKAELEEKKAALQNEDVDVWSLFEDYALLGDSRGVGFSYYKCLAPERVFAGAGWTIRNIEEQVPSLKALNPSSIFLCFGLNDTSIGFWKTPEEYANGMQEVVEMLQRELPNATIYVNSILPAQEVAFAKSSKWREIPQYSAAVKKRCAEMGVPFVDNDGIAAKYSDLYDIDGIHLRREFYRYWGIDMIGVYYDVQAGMYESGVATNTDADAE